MSRTEPQPTSSKGRVGPEPRTEAGRALLEVLDANDRANGDAPVGWAVGIVQVEQEAAALLPEPTRWANEGDDPRFLTPQPTLDVERLNRAMYATIRKPLETMPEYLERVAAEYTKP